MLGAFFSVFFLLGSAVFYGAFGKPIARIIAARDWASTSCQILASQVHTNYGSDGNTYRVDVRYRYTADGRTHIGDRYNFMGGSSSGYTGKAAAVARLAPGTRTDCCRLPLLHRCETSPQLVAELTASLGVALSEIESEQLYARHRGNLRDALREMYDRA